MAIEAIKSFIQRAQLSGIKSTALYPLQWLIAILVSGLLLSFTVGAPSWVPIALFILCALTFILFGIAYSFFMVKDPDALRSERYSLSKMAIEKGLFGDNIFGTFESTVDQPVTISTSEELTDEK